MGKSKEHVYNRFFTDEKWNEVNKINKAIMDDYIQELQQNQKKETTITQYTNDWRIVFIKIMEMFGNCSILELGKKDWRKLSLYFKNSCEHSNARVNRLMSAIRSMLNYCEDDDEYDYVASTASKVKGMPKEAIRDIVFYTDEEIFKILEVLVANNDYQKATALMLAYDSAGRKNELLQVEKHSFYNKNQNATNEVIGKRGKPFQLVYFSKTKEMANLYLEQRGLDDIDSLFIVETKEGKREASSGVIYNWFKQMNKILEEIENRQIGGNVHSLRHSCLENMSQSVHTHYALIEVGKPDGLTLEELQLHANHNSSDTTQSYLKDKTGEQKLSMFNLSNNEETEETK